MRHERRRDTLTLVQVMHEVLSDYQTIGAAIPPTIRNCADRARHTDRHTTAMVGARAARHRAGITRQGPPGALYRYWMAGCQTRFRRVCRFTTMISPLVGMPETCALVPVMHCAKIDVTGGSSTDRQ